MQYLHIRRCLLTTLMILLSVPAIKAQTNGNRHDLVNKKWRIVAMRCPTEMNTNDEDQFVHHYGSLSLKPANASNINYGTYIRVNRDQSDNPVQHGTYALMTDDMNGTRLVLTPHNGDAIAYRVELVYENHLTLINLGDARCKVIYAIAP
ncbi:MAG: hypothetical protein H0X33_07195 [Taibaiella sp.]|nr:hypothetical protein [Taibaiella sp.]